MNDKSESLRKVPFDTHFVFTVAALKAVAVLVQASGYKQVECSDLREKGLKALVYACLPLTLLLEKTTLSPEVGRFWQHLD